MAIEDILSKIARPELYMFNIFRITELPVDVEARDLSRRQATIKQALDIGVPIPPGYGRILPLDKALDANQLNTTFQLFEDPERRLIDEIFWFWPQPTADGRRDTVLQALGRGEIESTYQRWQRERDLPADEGTALHNLAVLSHAQVLDGELTTPHRELTVLERHQQFRLWQEAFACWKALLEQEAFWSRVTARIRALADPRLITGVVPRFRAQLPVTLLLINARLAVAAAERGNVPGCYYQLDLIASSGFDKQTADEALHRAIEPLHERIKALCKMTDEKTFAEPTQGHTLSTELLDQTAPVLKTLDLLLPDGDATREGIHDEIADIALIAETRYGNKTDDWRTYLPVSERIEPLVAGELLFSRLKSEREKVKGFLESRLCWYCHTGYVEEKAEHKVKMYGNVMRYYVGYNRRRVQWQNLTISVGRCSDCADMHGKVEHWRIVGRRLGTLFALISGGIIFARFAAAAPPTSIYDSTTGNYVPGPPDLGGAILGGLAIGIVLVVLFSMIGARIGKAISETRYLKPQKVRAQNDVRSHPVVKEWLSRGWRIGNRPTAY